MEYWLWAGTFIACSCKSNRNVGAVKLFTRLSTDAGGLEVAARTPFIINYPRARAVGIQIG
jgi:hypothetical protein